MHLRHLYLGREVRAGQLCPQGCKLFSNFSVFNGFRLADSTSCFDAAKGTVNLIGDAILFISDNKVLTFGS